MSELVPSERSGSDSPRGRFEPAGGSAPNGRESDTRNFEAELLASAHVAVLAQLSYGGMDQGPAMRALEVLESLGSPAGAADARVKLALDVVRALGGLENAPLSVRALKAAASEHAQFVDLKLKRKWLLYLGAVEVGLCHWGASIQHLVTSLEIARELKDCEGEVYAWNNIALLSDTAGQYEDTVRYASIALRQSEQCFRESGFPVDLGGPLLNRGNALRRLGQVDAAIADVAAAATLCLISPQSLLTKIRSTKCLSLLSSCHLERGDQSLAAEFLAAAEKASCEEGMPAGIGTVTKIVRAEFLMANGDWRYAASLLSELRNQPLQVDTRADVLYALMKCAKAMGRDADAEKWLSELAANMRSSAQEVVIELSRLPEANSDLSAALRQVDSALRRARSVTCGDLGAAWSNLIGLAAKASAVEDRTGEHGVRVAELAEFVGEAMGLESLEVEDLTSAALLHDIGKLAVPNAILKKVEPLTEHEQSLMDTHCEDGARLIESSSIPNRRRIADIVRVHHMRFDSRVCQESNRDRDYILVAARILAACDRFDVAIMGRPRRSPLSIDLALHEVLCDAGRSLDPQIVGCLVECVRRLLKQHEDLVGFLSRKAELIQYTAAQRRLKRASADEGISTDA